MNSLVILTILSAVLIAPLARAGEPRVQDFVHDDHKSLFRAGLGDPRYGDQLPFAGRRDRWGFNCGGWKDASVFPGRPHQGHRMLLGSRPRERSDH